ncbi:hypothetical protein DH2020_020766 [Rehmannia glutinosa]|uniref:Uncharacterized protein n=1 Tax=Rehmannia glutinosa TaxID=99300 RepID=A0ABR0W8G9_REHGL
MGNADAPNPSLLDLLKKILLDFGNELLIPCDSIEELLQKLDKLENLLSIIYQDFREMFEVALQPSKDALIADEFTRHAEMDVRVSVASCISEIVRIYAPDGPYEKEQMKIAVSAFESLACMSGRAYSKAVSILGTMSYSKSCVLMLDLQCHDLVHQMFHLFLNGIRTSHSDAIFSNMENIMTAIIRSNYDCDESTLELAKILLARLKKENQNVSSVAFQLAENTFKNCSNELKTYLLEAIRCLGIPVEDYAEVVVSLFHDATQRENMLISVASLRHWLLSLDLYRLKGKLIPEKSLTHYTRARVPHLSKKSGFQGKGCEQMFWGRVGWLQGKGLVASGCYVDYDDGDSEILIRPCGGMLAIDWR